MGEIQVMNLKTVLKGLTITAVVSQTAVYPMSSYAESKDEKQMDIQAQKNKDEKLNQQGLVGYYFKNANFTDLSFIRMSEQSELFSKTNIHSKKESIQSARWIGRMKPSQTGEYLFSTSSDSNVVLQVNGETIIKQGKMATPIKLEKDKVYELKMEYQNIKSDRADLQVFWSVDGKEKEQIPQNNLLSPDFQQNEKKGRTNKDSLLIPEFNLFNNDRVTDLKDTDNDGIPDEWEESGYTFKNQEIIKWDDSYLELGYKKYMSNPYKARTVADPYTDFEKVSGHIPAATKEEARDPLVAAYPAVGVGMEKLLFSKNENVTEGGSGTKSKSVTNSNATTSSVEVGSELTLNPFGGMKMSLKYGQSWNSSTSVQNTDSETWSKQIGLNTAEAAYLNANVRYYNAGTAPIYELRPTTNFVLQNSGASIATITAGSNQIGNSLAPGDTYPKLGQAPISLDKANEGGSTKIAINAEQLNEIQERSEILKLETTQNKGQYGVLDQTGHLVTDASKQWDPVRTNVDAVSSSLILDSGTSNDSLERRIAAKNENDPEDKTPEITIGEAIKKAFNGKEKNGKLYYTDRNGKNIILDESAVTLIGDERTEKEINKQLAQMQDKKIYNAKWKRDMNLTIRAAAVYYDFEEKDDSKWNGIVQENGGFTGTKHGRMSPGGNGSAKDELKLKPLTAYTARAYVKTSSPTEKNTVSFFVDDNKNGNGKGATHPFTVEGEKWQQVEFSFFTGYNPEYYKYIGFTNRGKADLHFDDVSVTEWGARNGNLVNNGNFSKGDNYWTLTDGYGEIHNDEYLVGTRVNDSSPKPAGKTDRFKVKPNTTYRLTFDLRANPGSAAFPMFSIREYQHNSSSNGSLRIYKSFSATSNWKQYEYEFTTTPYGNYLTFEIEEIRIGNKFNVDNISITEMRPSS